ncbi:MAG: gliding motility protein GldC [Saprospiraceae bacterium]
MQHKIEINIELDESKMPVGIVWSAPSQGENVISQEAKGMLLSFFDLEHKDTFKIDLWTKDMQVEEMDRFMFQTLRALADTYLKATQNKSLANDMQRFVSYFGESVEIIANKKEE